MDYVIRPVRADEWRSVKELRLAALQDPAAPVAFLETYEQGLKRSDEAWRERTVDASEDGGGEVRQFVAEGPDGAWAGSVTVLVEGPDVEARFGEAASVNQGHLVGVFVRPEVRGAGVADALFRAAVDWAWSLEAPRLERVRLYVHENNPRAEAFYRRFGFVPTGESVPMPGDPDARELEYAVARP
ncbi:MULTISPECIES: GNAT family N-acetyltransferase [unclassified Streptomyces]|uniref:GNAT family N-acetyltransferase n=1 Tax=unclassified Streptomyces TaxID=2593676 RepID=UPI00035FDCD2|nr:MULTISPECIES: GNAT family N-acetyltransferase [unclassified Streptomyces]MYQ78578.1 GNAT family N-acetyltransferase [Streptomyces sp. SID4923]